MAVRKMSEGVSSWNNKTPFPKERYQITCVEETFSLSKSSDNPMLTRVWEIVGPEVVQFGEKKLAVTGLTLTQYVTIKVKDKKTGEWDAEASDKNFSRFRDELLLMGFDPDGSIDDENPPCFMMGKTAEAILYSKKDVSRKAPTPEQLKAGQKQGDPIKDASGNDIVSYTLAIESILGPTSGPTVAF